MSFEYEESLRPAGLLVVIGISVFLTIGVLLYLLRVENMSSTDSGFILLSSVLLVLIFVLLNIRRLKIRISPGEVKVGYGIFSKTIPDAEIEDCYADTTSTVLYGGWGIRLSRVDGFNRLVFNTMGDSRVVIRRKTGLFREIVVSTKNPDRIVNHLTK